MFQIVLLLFTTFKCTSGSENLNKVTFLCDYHLVYNACLRSNYFIRTFLTMEQRRDVCMDISSEWNFDKTEFVSFPLDPIEDNYVRRNINNAIFSVVDPTPLGPEVRLAALSPEVLEMLDLDPSVAQSPQFLGLVSGGWIHPSSTPLAHRYGGHQFGWWAEQLGDGRAHLLGVYTNKKNIRVELQLKGSGMTPYSRNGDGRAVVRSSVREFLAAEAMAALGFRTSRCLSLVTSDEVVTRDPFYNGNSKLEKAAVVLRVAQSWFRFGSLEILTRRDEVENLRLLVNHVIDRHYPDIDSSQSDCYLKLFSRIVEETAKMISEWQSIGFTHGVMNTDNMSLLSIAIDYGPFGFLDEYNPNFIPNSSDDEGMYSYKNQPKIGFANLQKLGRALVPVLNQSQIQESLTILKSYNIHFQKFYNNIFSKKLGFKPQYNEENVRLLIEQFLKLLKDFNLDFSNSFWELGNVDLHDLKDSKFPKNFWSLPSLSKNTKFHQFINSYEKEILSVSNDSERKSIMKNVNPKYILRNWMAQRAITKAEFNDFEELKFLHKILTNPFQLDQEAEDKGYSKQPPKWSKSLKVSCSS